MLSEQDKQEMLTDGASRERRDAFRKSREKQTTQGALGPIDFKLLAQMQKLFPGVPSPRKKTTGKDFRL